MKTSIKILLAVTALYLFLALTPPKSLDCTRYHDHTFYGVTVNCDKGGAK